MTVLLARMSAAVRNEEEVPFITCAEAQYSDFLGMRLRLLRGAGVWACAHVLAHVCGRCIL
jgi:hypothetical protein